MTVFLLNILCISLLAGKCLTSKWRKFLYKLYRKPNDKPIYINKQYNHPPNVLKQLPKSIAKRISDTSSKDIFDKSTSIYQNTLCESGFKEELKYTLSDKSFQEENGQRTRRRKRIWFNPPYSRSMKTNIGRNFPPY